MCPLPDPDLHVREALPGDAARICALAHQLGYDVPEAYAARMLATRGAEHEIFAAVLPRVGVVGWIEVRAEAHLLQSHCVLVDGLVVEDEYRSTGIGAALLESAERWARAVGARAVRVRSNVLRERAHGFYEGNGYVRAKSQHLFEKRLV